MMYVEGLIEKIQRQQNQKLDQFVYDVLTKDPKATSVTVGRRTRVVDGEVRSEVALLNLPTSESWDEISTYTFDEGQRLAFILAFESQR